MYADVVGTVALGLTLVQFAVPEIRRRLRAILHVDVRVIGADSDGVLWTEGSGVYLRVEITVRNTGRKHAENVQVEVDLPYHLYGARWVTAGGDEREGESMAKLDHQLAIIGGIDVDAGTMSTVISSVPERRGLERVYLRLNAEVGGPGQKWSVPAIVRADGTNAQGPVETRAELIVKRREHR